ncbi:hypothetical protein Pcinc_036908 [Petrolisthes cinctipes]|uniref:Uncharacterized protein n=1 Tax=Petrolisthes cinctipes TaxID=88211 RepID=A0AAE1BTS6_PETCI|nr:hypothetical protein Pcinc_036908 [Petrolisthes cinctipes]
MNTTNTTSQHLDTTSQHLNTTNTTSQHLDTTDTTSQHLDNTNTTSQHLITTSQHLNTANTTSQHLNTTSQHHNTTSQHLDNTTRHTHRGRSSSFQSLELSGLEDVDRKGNKSQHHKGSSSSKINVSGIKASIRASFRRSQNNLAKATSSSKISAGSEVDGVDGRSQQQPQLQQEKDKQQPQQLQHHQQQGQGGKEGKLNRERSGSLLSVKSFSRLNLGSFRLSSKRIGSGHKMKLNKSHSATSTPLSHRKEFNDEGDCDNDDVSVSSLQNDVPRIDDEAATVKENNGVDGGGGGDSGGHDATLDITPMTSADLRKSFRQMFSTPRRLRAYRSLREKKWNEQETTTRIKE